MLKRPFKSVIARIAIVALALSLVFPFIPAALADGHISLTYAENGTGPVATFTATDQDGDAIEWSLNGADKKLFTIDGGVLAFKDSPDYEDPKSASTGTRADKNVYNVTLMAAGGSQKVAVTVTNVDEDGKVTFGGLGKYQPQAGRSLSASLKDQDGGQTDEKWQWARSSDMETWTDIDKATSASRSPVADDVGSYLRATVTYTDIFDSGKTASAVTMNKVEARTVANAAPSFKDQDDDNNGDTAVPGTQVNRKVDENSEKGTPIGKPVSATDADNDMLLYLEYTLTAGADMTRFDIDPTTGQLKVKQKLDFEGTTASDSTDRCAATACSVTVTATDPSGAETPQVVTIAIVNVNEAPKFKTDIDGDREGDQALPTVLYVAENQDGTPPAEVIQYRDGTTNVNLPPSAYAVTDQDITPEANTGSLTYSVVGADQKYFNEAANGTLAFLADDGHTPNYEKKSSYSITIVAQSGAGNGILRASTDVTVKVTDAEDAGSVELSQREPQVGQTVIATVSDPDGGIAIGGATGTGWVWALSAAQAADATSCAAVTTFGEATTATTAAYTPKASDANKCLQITVTYTDAQGTANESAVQKSDGPIQASDPANTAPKFPDQDLATQGDQSDETSRSVKENADVGTTVGAAVAANDDDKDLLLYTLNGADSGSFKIDRATGGITTAEKFDYESKNTYMVAVNATDPSGAVDSILVTVNVTDENDPAVISGVKAVDYAENGTDPVATFTASDQDGDAIAWSLGGVDMKLFTIDDGVLAFKKSPDYEDSKSKSTGTTADKNVYNVIVQATGGEQAVAVTVTNVDEAGKVTFSKQGQFQPQAGRTLEASLADQDGGVTDANWQWARSSDMETWTDIDGATSQNRSPVADDVGSYLRATVSYTDSFGTGKSASAVTDNAVEARTVANAAPSFKDQDDKFDDATTTDTVENAGIQINREVNENAEAGSPIGKAVSATDADNDVLVYTLSGGADKDRFSIDASTGQIKVKQALDFEGATDASPANNCTTTLNTCVVVVTATDPSGATNPDDGDTNTTPVGQPVTITIIEVNEAPKFGDNAKKTVWVTENLTDGTEQLLRTAEVDATGDADNLADNAYAATDNDSGENTITYTLEGADAKRFTILGGDLTFPDNLVADDDDEDDNVANFEKKSSYSITVVAQSGTGDRILRSRMDVTVNVVDAEDPGTVTLSQLEPQVGQTVIATLSDPDGGMRVSKWEWFLVNETGDPLACPTTVSNDALTDANDIEGASSAAYTPKEGDVPGGEGAQKCLVARATYKDNIPGDAVPADTNDNDGDNDSEDVNDDGVWATGVSTKAIQASDPANTAPKFPDQDAATSGDQSDETSRSVAENKDAGTNVGTPVTAVDGNDDAMLYTLSGADADSFKINRATAQITTAMKLDYETKSTYMVVVTATDPSGAQDSILVTVNVTDVDDPADIVLGVPEPENVAPAFASDTVTLNVQENSAGGATVGDPVTATDADDDDITYSLSGSDAFEIDSATGQIAVAEGASLDYETQTSYTVTVTASDGTESASAEVTINIGNVGLANAYDTDDSGTISKVEAVNAVKDYFDDELSREDVLAVIRLYFG